MPITFRHQLMDYVNAEAPSYERLMDSVTQTVLKDMKLPASSTPPYEVQRPTTTSTSVPTESPDELMSRLLLRSDHGSVMEPPNGTLRARPPTGHGTGYWGGGTSGDALRSRSLLASIRRMKPYRVAIMLTWADDLTVATSGSSSDCRRIAEHIGFPRQEWGRLERAESTTKVH